MCKYGNFPSSADSEYYYADLGQYPFFGYSGGRDAAVRFDIAVDATGVKYAINVRAQ